MSNERDELAQAIEHASHNGGSAVDMLYPNEARHFADAVLAAGYRKPRTITSVEELRALPIGAMVMDTDPDVCRKVGLNTWRSLTETADWTYPSEDIVDSGPFTVLWEPAGE